ncbi:hypothetical protein GJAV_G00002180 [Gymnothorax javanicus]|nr:hypothetical protein GJAV_G00002180 [Gymnothorax javanicus]
MTKLSKDYRPPTSALKQKNMQAFIPQLIINLNLVLAASCCSVPECLHGVRKTGDIIIGGLFPVHKGGKSEINDTSGPCTRFDLLSFLQSHVMIYSIEVINNSSMLPNLTLGYEMYDTYGDVSVAIKAALRLMEVRGNSIDLCSSLRNEWATFTGGAKAVIGERDSEVSIAVARLLALPLIPQISYASTSEVLSRKSKFPSFLRTVPSDKHQTKAMAALIKKLNWESVGLIGSEDEYGKFGVESLIDHLNASVCQDFKVILPSVISLDKHREEIESLLKTIKGSKAEVIVIFTKTLNVKLILSEVIKQHIHRTWIAADSWSTSPDISNLAGIHGIGEVFGFIHRRNVVPGFEEYLRGFTIQPNKENSFFQEYMNESIYCISSLESVPTGQHPQNGSFHNVSHIQNIVKYTDQDASYGIYLAVNVIAKALQRLLKCDNTTCNRNTTFSTCELLEEIKQVNFTVDNTTDIEFDEHGDPRLGYEILLWDMKEGNVTWSTIGNCTPTGDILIPKQLIEKWNNITVTGHNCSKSCRHGYELSSQTNDCCKICKACPSNQYSPGGKEPCRSCNDTQYVSPEKNCCLPKYKSFLSWKEGLPIALAIVGLVGFVFTLLVAVLFVKYRDTPIVKGTGGNLCFLILFSLTVSFVSLFLFIGEPSDITCKVGLLLFILSFSLCVSCLLANLFQIFVGFTFDTKAHNLLQRLNNPVAIVTGCMAVQVTLCTVWLTFFPPHQEVMPSRNESLLVKCQNGSDAMFAVTLGYIAFLAVVCFLFGFKGKRLPDLYKNASFVTISMLIYLVVWMLFIPVYINMSSKYMQAVEVGAMLVSNYSVLCCHFCPKCYIILFRKELNNEKVITEYIRKHYEKKGVSPVTAK